MSHKPPRALRRLFPIFPQGEMAREDVMRGIENELDEETIPGVHGPLIRHIDAEARQLYGGGGDPLLDALEEPDPEDDWWDPFEEP